LSATSSVSPCASACDALCESLHIGDRQHGATGEVADDATG
jgi:hypothetical protein